MTANDKLNLLVKLVDKYLTALDDVHACEYYQYRALMRDFVKQEMLNGSQ